jgi:hypothetical protein
MTNNTLVASVGQSQYDAFDDQDTLTLQCVFAGRSEKAMWLTCPDGKTRAFAISKTHIMSGEQRQGASITVQVKGWMYKQAFVKGEQRTTNPTQAALPAPVATNAQPNGADEITVTMNTRMLKRLIWLCDPAKHGGNEHAVIARGFLNDVMGGV